MPQNPTIIGRVLDPETNGKLEHPGMERLIRAFLKYLDISIAQGRPTEDTVEAYIREAECWLQWCVAQKIDPVQARRQHIELYRRALLEANLKPATRALKISIVRRFYDAAVDFGLIQYNPAARVMGGKDLTPPEEKIHALTVEALTALLGQIPMDTLPGKRDRAIIALMAVHGLRRVEIHRLDHAHIRLSENEAPSVRASGKGYKERTVYLRDDTAQALAVYLNAKMQGGYTTEADKAVFVAHGNNCRGERLSRRALNRIVDGALTGADLKRAGVSCHALRHTFGTLAVAGGANIEQLREAMGHERLETTGLYIKALERARHNPANFVAVKVESAG